MKLGFCSALVFLLAAHVAPLHAASLAGVIEVDAATAIYYFTSDSEKIAQAETENGENNQTFHAAREPRLVARDFAREELQHGNVCLNQAARDLKHALKTNQITKLCRNIFKDDIAVAAKRMKQVDLKPDYLHCVANAEARETQGGMRLVLSFRSQLVSNEKIPGKLAKAGFQPDVKGWALPTHEAPLGDMADGWKGVLKNGSCTLDDAALAAFLDRYMAQAREARALASCRSKYGIQADRMTRLQGQFKEYVPDEWLAEVGESSMAALLQRAPGPDSLQELKDCRSAKVQLVEQLKRLRKISGKLADKHDLPALDPENQPGARELASEDDDF